MTDLPTAQQALEMAQMRGMIWWLASEIAADTPEDDTGDARNPEAWVALAEKYWRLGLRYETRFLHPYVSDPGT